MVVKRSGERASAKPAPSQEEVERLANELADRPFGGTQDTAVQVEIDKDPEQPEPAKTKRRSITLSLPQVVVEQLEAQALENKHQGKKEKNVSALVLVALKKAGYKP